MTSPAVALEAVRISLLVEAQAGAVGRAFAEHGISSLFLKGASLERWLYGPGEVRGCGDVDFLVAPAQHAAAEAVLQGLGFVNKYDGASPAWAEEHADSWQTSTGTIPVDLHRHLWGMGMPPQVVWEHVWAQRDEITLAGITLATPGPAARALLVALHVAHHRADLGRPMEDLERALRVVPRPTWAEAAALASALGAQEGMAAGLARSADGAVLRDELGLDEAAPDVVVRVAEMWSKPATTAGFLRLLQATSLGERVGILRREVLPSKAFMEAEGAARGQATLASHNAPAAYLMRLGRLLRAAPRGLREARSLRRTWRDRESLERGAAPWASADALRVVVLPRPDVKNPYQALLMQALASHGVRAVPTPAAPTLLWAARTGELDAVHLHWLEFLLHSGRGRGIVRRTASTGRTLRLLLALSILRARGVRIVWTLHNLRPHEPIDPRLEAFAYTSVLRIAHRVFVHSEAARRRVREEWGGAGDVAVLHHGNYIGAYPPSPVPRDALRRALGIPDGGRAFLLFGGVRRYKCVPEAVTAFRGAAGPEDRLLVVGDAPHDGVRQEVLAAAEGDPRVLLRFGFVPDDEVAGWFAAADAMVLNYHEVLSSGALMLALSFGVPVIAPEGGTPEEVALPGAVETFGAGGLGPALASLDPGELVRRRPIAHASAVPHTWDCMAEALVAAFARRGGPGQAH